jgi:multidrug efflux pump subunit AcrB
MQTPWYKSQQYNTLVVALCLIIVILGAVMGVRLPNALLPTIHRAEIEVFTSWPGKSSEEIEQNLVTPLENALHGLNNLVMMQSSSNSGGASIRLEFSQDSDMQQTYIDVMSRVNQVPGWPSEVQRPVVQNNSGNDNNKLATAMFYSNGIASQEQLIQAFQNKVAPLLRKVKGVTKLDPIYNRTEQRIDIEFDPKKLALYSLPLSQVMQSLNNLADSSGDSLTLGSRQYALHFKGQMEQQALLQLPIYRHNEHIIRLQDIATIHKRMAQKWNYASINGHRAFYFVISANKGINALAALDEIKQHIMTLNQGALGQLNMTLVLSRDDSKGIRNSISQIYNALFMGILLAGAVLLYFLRNIRLLSLIFISIPLCLALTLTAMKVLGYSINVISLAGMALSVGLVLDAAIVVIENITRLKRQGLSLTKAISEASLEVRSAVISSTFSSIVIFVPILLMTSTESQLFKDLAFTLTSALLASLLVALIVLPVLSRLLLAKVNLPAPAPLKSDWVRYLTCTSRSKFRAYSGVILGVPFALITGYLLMPSIDVLPDPKQRMIISFINIDDPMSREAVFSNLVTPIAARIKQQKNASDAPDYDVTGTLCLDTFCLVYFYPSPGWHYPSFKHWVETKITHELPGVSVFSRQSSLLRFAMPDNRATQLDIQGASLDVLQQAGKKIVAQLKQAMPEANFRPNTPLDNKLARVEFTPNDEQLIYYNLTRSDLNRHLLALSQGIFLGRFYTQGNTYPFYFKSHDPDDITALLATQIVIPGFGLRPLSELVSADLGLAPGSLLRINQQATISLNLRPPQNITVGDFAQAVTDQIQKMQNNQVLDGLNISYRGSADRLALFLQEFVNMFIFSMLILLFLLWLSLSSWKLACSVLLSMPIAFVGGMLSLKAINLVVPQNLDVITMIGFIILMGLVINNAILLASKYQQGISQGQGQQDAIYFAVASRRRPIYMSTGTSIFGMLPLMLMPGEGAEMYRGLAAVIIGGMTFSALFSLSFMSALLSLPCYRATSIAKLTLHRPDAPQISHRR